MKKHNYRTKNVNEINWPELRQQLNQWGQIKLILIKSAFLPVESIETDPFDLRLCKRGQDELPCPCYGMWLMSFLT